MPMVEEETVQIFGYTTTGITKGMAKWVVWACDKCGDKFKIIRKNVKAKGLCKKCAYKEVPRENYAKGIVKREATCTELYGQSSKPFLPSAAEKRQKTNLEKFGAATPMGNAGIAAKARKTCLERFDAPCFPASVQGQEQIRKSMLARWGAEHMRQVPELNAKAVATLLVNHGVTNPGQSKALKAKALATSLVQHGALTPKNYGGAEAGVLTYVKQFQTASSQFIMSTGQSLDIVIPDKQLAIEYCGLYWHHECSPTPRKRNYHRDKMKAAANHGFQLLTIFEDEWRDRRQQVEGYIRSKIDDSCERIMARKCTVTVITRKVSDVFLETHHIQGPGTKSLASFGLFHKEDLIGVMAFSKHHRRAQRGEIVLSRLGFKTGINVTGGAQKLFAAACVWVKERGYMKVVTWSDNRWSLGSVYPQLGFTQDAELYPDYMYVNIAAPRFRLSKQSKQKRRFNCPPGVTEHEGQLKEGFARIWDCGKKRWVYSV